MSAGSCADLSNWPNSRGKGGGRAKLRLKPPRRNRRALQGENPSGARQTRNERLSIFLKYKPETKYEAMASMELMLDTYDPQAKERHQSNFDGRMFIPRVENAPFIHDMHTGRGKALWVRSFGEAWRTKNFQIGEIDARWSGSTLAVLWRERCHAQKGSMKRPDGRDWPWSDFQVSEKDYLNAYHLEEHFYASLMDRVRRAHPDLDCFKLDDGPGTRRKHDRTHEAEKSGAKTGRGLFDISDLLKFWNLLKIQIRHLPIDHGASVSIPPSQIEPSTASALIEMADAFKRPVEQVNAEAPRAQVQIDANDVIRLQGGKVLLSKTFDRILLEGEIIPLPPKISLI